MSEPFVIYNTETGEELVCHAPRWAAGEVEAGRYSYDRPDAQAAVNFTVVNGIGPTLNDALHDAGITTWAGVLDAEADGELDEIDGMNVDRLANLLGEAQERTG